MARLRLGLDARLLGAGHSGLGRYTAELLRGLRSYAPDIDLVVFARPSATSRATLKGLDVEMIEAPYRPYSWREQWEFPRQLNAARLDLVHFPHFNVPLRYRGSYVVTIHDLILHHFPSRQTSQRHPVIFWSKYVTYRLVLREVLRRAAAIVAVSAYTAEDLLTYYPRIRPRLHVIPEAPPSWAVDVADKTDHLSYTVSRPYVLVVGNFYPHKNLDRLLTVWGRLYKLLKLSLVIVGREDAFTEALKRQARALELTTETADSPVRFLGFVPDKDLELLYRGATACLCPSRYEGVGLPGLEALVLDTPVLSSAETALPETYGRAATYLPVIDVDHMYQALVALLSPPPRRSTSLWSPTVTLAEVMAQLRHCYAAARRPL